MPVKPIFLKRDLRKDTTLSHGRDYLVVGQLHVLAGVTLSIEDGVTVYLQNGAVGRRKLRRSALIFDSGSSLLARRVKFRAANDEGQPQKLADNGGVWFFGAHRSASKDGLKSRVDEQTALSYFKAERLSFSYLGRRDPAPTAAGAAANPRDDLDAVSVMGVGLAEWKIKSVKIHFAGDDGLDLTNSHILMNEVMVKNPTEDALNISSSRLDIIKTLKVVMTENEWPDRDIFDLEVDAGPSSVVLHRGAKIDISGVFGDQLMFSSQDMPQPDTADYSIYTFNGRSDKSASVIYSIDSD